MSPPYCAHLGCMIQALQMLRRHIPRMDAGMDALAPIHKGDCLMSASYAEGFRRAPFISGLTSALKPCTIRTATWPLHARYLVAPAPAKRCLLGLQQPTERSRGFRAVHRFSSHRRLCSFASAGEDELENGQRRSGRRRPFPNSALKL